MSIHNFTLYIFRNFRKICIITITIFSIILSWWGWKFYEQSNLENKFDELIEETSKRHFMNPYLIKAVIKRESAFRKSIRGKAGEYGLMQITPGAADDWCRVMKKKKFTLYGNLLSPSLNVEIGVWYLARGMKRFRDYKHSKQLGLAYYNAGIKNVKKWLPKNKSEEILNKITFPSTKKYIIDIINYEQYYKKMRVFNNERN